MDDELYDEENPMEHHDRMEQLWNETRENLKEKRQELLDSQSDNKTAAEGISEKASNLKESVKDSGADLVDDLKEKLTDVSAPLTEKTGNLFDGISDVGADVTSSVTEATGNIVDGAKDLGSKAIESTSEMASNVVDKGSSLASGTTIAVGAVASGLLVGAKKMAEKTFDGASDLAEGNVNTVKEHAAQSSEALNEAGETISEKAAQLVDDGKQSINEAASSFVDNDIPAVLRPKDIFKDEEVVVDENDDRLEPAKQKIADILLELKENNYNKDYGILGYLLSFPLILVAIWQFIQMGFTVRIGVVVLLAVFFVVYRGAVKGITKQVFDLKARVQVGQMTPIQEIFGKIDYVISGISLNLKRINYTKWLYILFTPFLLYGLGEIWKGPFDAKSTFYMFVVGYILSFIVWPLVFKADYKKLEELDFDLNVIRREFI